MEDGGVYDDSRMSNVMLDNERIPCTSDILDSLWASKSSPSFHGSASMVSFEDAQGENNTETPFFTQIDSKSKNCDDGDYDGCFRRPEKKRRLSPDQVQFLEKSFGVENKLEPDRKVQLAKELGLQPRQVAIWFQNRRARYKTKVLEKEYDSLKASYDKLKLDYDNLFKENEKMKNEVNLLTEKVLGRENGKVKAEPCDPISPLDLQPKKMPIPSQDSAANVATNSAKSDVLDSESPHYRDGNHSGSLEPAISSNAFESEDEDDSLSLSRSLVPAQSLCFPKLEVECCDDLQPNCCNFGFPVQDHGTWFWQY